MMYRNVVRFFRYMIHDFEPLPIQAGPMLTMLSLLTVPI